ncbi:DNA mismatch repair protein MutT [Methylobacterium sp. Leaf469]|jgi:8-oxo-dGTP pyrophosphatase MutT (NUDIX family)|uniref:NUDIX domain-containing protein n=1 Tax=unclassified Methylobacterium TaxID=2615210 RepID=UPI0006F47103|nr:MULTISPECIES: NUDIX domain-containing protein [unclassified Methylobacterium]USU31787.1 NUDIX domain-containing protein [Methylobacterium sp. OTU13CASTA1]KQO70468.1 DNA mismatch repair protein MutT [Methylobacterium sp. Leaf87]KQP32475.1 DNA mismatch repair protein MutT [Methylobacterium sp. Leaf102]KQP33005.1 DNA mismatch repair protein MutT [Methylobacterium sp. Leaf100]KQP68710.1 DNA mismatch repair protein MutT [Methylobacterium sp. Leaf112]
MPSTLGLLDRPLLRRLFHLGALATRGMTLGVRGAAIDGQGRVCLVRHTYVAGWHLPGGGVEVGENAVAAMIREFREEAGIVVDPGETLRLHGFYHHATGAGRDHVALYLAPAFTVPAAKRPDREIAESGFFRLDALPEATTSATRARLREIREGLPPAAQW